MKKKASYHKKEWIVFEEVFKINPQTVTSYAAHLKDKDYLREYLKENLGIKNCPPQEVVFIYKKGNMKLCYNIFPLETLAKKIFRKIIKNPSWAVRVNQDVKKRSNRMFKIGKGIFRFYLSKLTNQQLYELYQKWQNAYLNMHVSGWFGNLADYEGAFTKYLSQYLEKKIKSTKLSFSIPEILNILTQQKELSHLQKEEVDILCILKILLSSKRLKELFLKESAREINQKLPSVSSKIDRLLDNHVKKYGWLSYQFEGPGWSREYFIKRLKELIKTGTNPDNSIKEIKNRIKEAIQNQKKLIKQLEIDKKHQELFRIYGEIVFLKGYRKDALFFGCYSRDFLLKEVAKRVNLPLRLLRYVYFDEMEEVILKGKTSKSLLRERFNYHVYYYQEGKGKKILVGKEAQRFVQNLKWKEIKIKKVHELKGMPASPGKVKGIVAIIDVPEEMKKMRQNNILVSEATSPDLLPAIKKASAIITNVGGITCHAAIVSRELGIPCIIGTKIATKVLKDGDLVEVDAEKGIVKILKRKNETRSNHLERDHES